MKLSVVIPTLNRASLLQQLLASLLVQTVPPEDFEVIVVDNGSADGTAAQAQAFLRVRSGWQCVLEPEPGLHAGRHRGLRESRADVLAFLDDDVTVCPHWVESLLEAFAAERVHLAGGPVRPRFERSPPPWLEGFRALRPGGWTLSYLSLLDFGDCAREVEPKVLPGCNFAIRKSVLLECGGFHPDSMPADLISRRGDGETHVAACCRRNGHRARYHPGAAVYHHIAAARLTPEYFCRRAFLQGISDSYTAVRARGGCPDTAVETPAGMLPRLPLQVTIRRVLQAMAGRQRWRSPRQDIDRHYCDGVCFHRGQVRRDPALLAWVTRPDYFQ